MHVNLQDLIRFRQSALNLSLPEGVEDACQSMCCANPGQDPSEFSTVADFVAAHGPDQASPFFAMPVDELVGHGTACGAIPNAFTADFVTLLKNHGATTVIFFADFDCRDIVNAESDTVELGISGGGFDADCSADLVETWRDGLSDAAVQAIETAEAVTLEDAMGAIPGGWSWRPEPHNGWTVCESE